MTISTGEKVVDELVNESFEGETQQSDTRSFKAVAVLWALIAIEFGIVLSGILQTKIQVVVVCVILLLTLMTARVPIAVSMGVVGLLGIWRISGTGVMERTLVDLPSASAASWSLSVIPMFIFMGLLLWKSGATGRIFDTARAWLNWLPGSLAITTNMAGAGLASVSGSTIGITYAISRIGIPEMFKSGYDKRLALGSVLLAGLPGQLIPPSLLLVIYAGIANLPVGPQVLSGILPGIMLVIIVNAAILILAIAFPKLAGEKVTGITWTDRWNSLARVWPIPVLMIVILGGLYGGFFTATETAAVGCVGALIITAAYTRGREFWQAVGSALSGAVVATGSIFFLLIGAAMVTRMFALSEVPFLFTQWIEGMGLTPTQFVIAAIGVILVLGMFMDPISLLLLSLPVVLPTLSTMGVDLLWFGVLAVIAAEIGMFTPPVGVLVFLVHKIVQSPQVNLGRSISLQSVFGVALACVPIALIALAILIAFPEIVTIIPETAGAR